MIEPEKYNRKEKERLEETAFAQRRKARCLCTAWNMYGVRCFVGTAGRGGHVFARVATVSPKKSLSSSSSDGHDSPNKQGEQHASVDYYAGRNHEFSASRSRDIIDYGHEHSAGTSSHSQYDQGSSGGFAEMSSADSDRADILSHNGSTAVSLGSCMQSNVPEPYNAQGRNPTHVNMPGGGILRSQKYVYGDLHRYHPSRQFSTSTALSSAQSANTEDFDIPCPQGIQGDDCVRFKIWYENCRRFNLPNCNQQLSSLESGRKTLAQVFTEEDSLVREVVQSYEKGLGEEVSVQAAQDDVTVQRTSHDLEGVQDLQDIPVRLHGATVEDLMQSQAPCPEGIQGSDCERFKVWLNNCSRFSIGKKCNEQLGHLRNGRKTLSQIFGEQDALLEKIAQQHVRPYSTASPGGQNDPSTAAEVSSERLTQRQKLQRAVKQYGATVVVFHVGISLLSLGGFYMAVSSGIDMVGILTKLGLGESILESRLVTGGSTFVVSYAVHKVFAPVRIAITLTSTPFIVRYLRSIGFLKTPKL